MQNEFNNEEETKITKDLKNVFNDLRNESNNESNLSH